MNVFFFNGKISRIHITVRPMDPFLMQRHFVSRQMSNLLGVNLLDEICGGQGPMDFIGFLEVLGVFLNACS